MRKNIANCFTLLNLVFGSIAVIYIMQGFTPNPSADTVIRQMCIASVFICLAGIVDFIDGLVARLLGVASEMGKQLDSLADLVSFGLAPGLIVFQFLKIGQAAAHPLTQHPIAYLLPALLVPCAGAYRLARFNVTVSSSLDFQGVPIPAGGILIASFPLIYAFNILPFIRRLLESATFWYSVIILVSFLMVSSIPMMSLKFKNLSLLQNWPKFLLVVLSVIAALLLHWLAIPVIFLLYVLLSLIILI